MEMGFLILESVSSGKKVPKKALEQDSPFYLIERLMIDLTDENTLFTVLTVIFLVRR